ncbi:hypothetical protein [Photobacterium lutimaris]|uniref:Uncharacterized protein n=1 Tax=Photobacterium lutimaris TaxID=388278 RepID=A0A2T3ITK7_9GAMM|nr:hypothetical protein [Photobacterium lutimaris]PSU31699.1 hypothetical protein C9I99_21160 [Photobacterium lutimaris]TDR72664.1 hypothetical protein DFP78_113140 [Photobacterium lutimaris]
MDKNEKWTVIEGSSPDGNQRILEVTTCSDGKAKLWVRPPNSENGYWIEVSAEELGEALKISNA